MCAVLLMAALVASVVGLAPSASGQQRDFEIVTQPLDLEPGQITTLNVRLLPAVSIGALSMTIEFPDYIAVDGTEILVPGGACAFDDDRINFAAFEVSGWSQPLDICSITIRALGDSGSDAPVIAIVAAVTPDTATNLVGTIAAGPITVGGLPPTPEPTAEPTAEPTVEPTVEPTSAPETDEEPTPEPEQAQENEPADDTDEASETDDTASESTASDDAGSDGRGSRAEAEPTADPDPDAGTESEDSSVQDDEAQTNGEDNSADDESADGPADDDSASDDPNPDADDSDNTTQVALPPLAQVDDGGSATPVVATIAIALLALGGFLGALTRRAKRHDG